MKHTEFAGDDRDAVGGTASRKPSAWARRRWPAAAGGLLLLLLAIFALARRGHDAKAAQATAPGESAEGAASREGIVPDSIVTLDSTALGLAGIQLAPVVPTGSGGLVANGTITYDANHVSVVAPRAEGHVVAVRADLGSHVGAGTVLAMIESREVGQARGELARARASLEVAQNNYERERRLYAESISSQKEMLEAQGAYKTALAEYDGALTQISGLGAQGGEGGMYGLTSPLSGTVVDRDVMPGQIVGPSTNLFTVADLRHVWITVDVYESDIPRVRTGAPATVVTRAMPGATFRGRVSYAGGVVDTSTRTLRVRVEVENAGQRLRPGMYAEVHIETPQVASAAASDGHAVVVPDLAVQDVNGKPSVFVPAGAPGRFVVRMVTVGPTAGGGRVTILKGLRRGDTVVVKGAFQLKSELMKASFGEDET